MDVYLCSYLCALLCLFVCLQCDELFWLATTPIFTFATTPLHPERARNI